MTTALALRPPTLRSAAELDDAALRVELAHAHAVGSAVNLRVIPRDRAMLQTRLAELDAEYLRRFPAAAATWPWPR